MPPTDIIWFGAWAIMTLAWFMQYRVARTWERTARKWERIANRRTD